MVSTHLVGSSNLSGEANYSGVASDTYLQMCKTMGDLPKSTRLLIIEDHFDAKDFDRMEKAVHLYERFKHGE